MKKWGCKSRYIRGEMQLRPVDSQSANRKLKRTISQHDLIALDHVQSFRRGAGIALCLGREDLISDVIRH